MYIRGVFDHANEFRVLLARKLKQRHLHVRVIHEPGIGNASAALIFELIESPELPFQLLRQPKVVVIEESQPFPFCQRDAVVSSYSGPLVLLVRIAYPFPP